MEKDHAKSKLIDVAQVDRTIAEIHHNHGCILAEMNRPHDALEHQTVFNQMMLEELGESPGVDMRLAMSFNELGVAYMINDSKSAFLARPCRRLTSSDWKKGEECFQRSVHEMRRLSDFEEYKISLPLVNWASSYILSRRHEEAEEILMKGLADRVETFGENDIESFMQV